MQWIFDGKGGNFNSLLLESALPDHEMAQKEAVLCAWRNIQSVHCKSRELQVLLG